MIKLIAFGDSVATEKELRSLRREGTDLQSLSACSLLYSPLLTLPPPSIPYSFVNCMSLSLNEESRVASNEYIDADRFHNLSIAGRARHSVTFDIHWIDSHNDSGYIAVVDTLNVTAADIGPYDLATLNNDWTGDIKKLWLEFNGGNVSSNVRIGWVKLTE